MSDPELARLRFRDPMPMIACDDLEATVAFYRDLLGFEPTYRYPDDGPEVFVVLELGGHPLGLGSTTVPPLHGRVDHAHRGHRFELAVTTDDVDDAVASLRRRGVRVLVEPCDQPWGERIAYVADPEDNPVMLLASVSDG